MNSARRPREAAVPLAFAAGAAAMILELVWARWLILAVGAGAPGLALTAAGTMLGLGLGGELGGRLAERSRRPRRLFGVLQLAAAASALGASALLRAAGGPDAPVLSDMVLRLGALAIVTVPSTLIGAALPALAADAARGSDRAVKLARLYAANTAGAVAGVLAAGFLLIQSVGLRESSWIACALAAIAGAAAFRADAEAPPLRRPTAPSSADLPRLAMLGAAASGFATMAYEVLDSRLLVHGFLGTTHALTITLAVFLPVLALGARLFAASKDDPRARVGLLGAALIAGAAVAVLFAPALTRTAALMAWLRASSWEARVAAEVAVASLLLLPSTTILGVAFPAALAAGADSPNPEEALGRALLVNALAGAAGALAAGFLLLPALGLRASFAAVALLQSAAGAWIVSRELAWDTSRRRAAWAFTLGLAGCAFAWARPRLIGGQPGAGTLVARHVVGRESQYRVLCYREGAVATTEVLENMADRRRDLVIDGFVTAGDAAPAGYMAMMGSLPARLCASPRRALVICFGTGATARAVAATAASVDIADINPDVLACAPSFGPENVSLLARADVNVEDGRRFLARGGPGYDVITQEPMPPYFAGTSALYSREYYLLARRRLNPDGVLVQWLPLHLVAPVDARQIVATALSVFPETWVALSPADGTALLVASPSPLDRERLARSQRESGARFALDPAGARRFAADVAPLSDDRPDLEYSGLDRVRGRYASSVDLQADNLRRVLDAAR